MARIGIMQLGMAKKVAAACHFLFASRFPKKDSRTDAKFAILESPSKGAFEEADFNKNAHVGGFRANVRVSAPSRLF